MTAATATLPDLPFFDAPALVGAAIRACRWTLRTATLGLSAAAAVGVSGLCATLAGVWIVTAIVPDNLNTQAKPPAAMRTFAGTQFVTLTSTIPQAPERTADLTLEAKMARARALVAELGAAMPPPQLKRLEVVTIAPRPIASPLPEPAAAVPLPRANPGKAEQPVSAPLMRPVPEKPAAPQVAALPPRPEPAAPKPVVPPRAGANELTGVDDRTAVYDISARTVYLPGGARLEAHSGLGEKMDDPRYIHVRMRGPTPPNVYTLTMREQLFHGVRAIRLNPVDGRKMFGRDGMLAHTYMLGPNGQSNGCVSFRDYDKFLQAFLDGEVNRLVVVESLNGAPPTHVARSGRAPAGRYAAAAPFDRAGANTW